MSEDQSKQARQWIDEAEEALSRTGDALRSAWTETKEARMATLETAREAATRLGRAIDGGIEAARESWESTQHRGATGTNAAESDASPSESDETDGQEEE